MATTLRAPNFDQLNIKDIKVLDAAANPGADRITLQNVANLSSGDFIYISYPVSQNTEKQQIQSISGFLAILHATIISPHQQFENVLAVFGDQIRFYRAANVDGTIPADGSFALQATVDITVDKYYTDWIDSTGSSAYWYKYTYYNSSITSETHLEDAVAVRGGDFGHYADIESIREEAGVMDIELITDVMIDRDRTAAESLVNGVLINNYSLPLPMPFPDIVVKLVTLLAAGYILSKQFSTLSPDMSRLGTTKIKAAMDILNQISARTVVLTDILGESLALPVSITGWPNNSTASTPSSQGGGKRMFHIRHKF